MLSDKVKHLRLVRDAVGELHAAIDVTGKAGAIAQPSYCVAESSKGWIVLHNATQEIQSYWKSYLLASTVCQDLNNNTR